MAISAPSIAVMLTSLGFMLYLIGRSTNNPNATHTEEIYHGNWWATYHTPRDTMYYNMATAALAATILVICLLGIYVALSSITWEDLATVLSGFWPL